MGIESNNWFTQETILKLQIDKLDISILASLSNSPGNLIYMIYSLFYRYGRDVLFYNGTFNTII